MTRTQIKNLENYLGDLKNQSDELEQRVEGRWSPRATSTPGSSSRSRTPTATAKDVEKGAKRSSITLEQYKQVHEELFETRLELALAEAWLTAVQDAAKAAAEQDLGAGRRRGPAPTGRSSAGSSRTPRSIDLAAQMMEARTSSTSSTGSIRLGGDPAVRKAHGEAQGPRRPVRPALGDQAPPDPRGARDGRRRPATPARSSARPRPRSRR